MKKQLLIAGLLCGLAGVPASAQLTPSPNDPHQQPGAATPGTPPTFPTDRQETSKDRQNRTDSDADSQQTDRDRQDQTDRDRQTQTDRDRQNTDQDRDMQQTDRDRQNPQRTDRDYDRDRNNGSTGTSASQENRDHDPDRDHRSDYQSQFQNALQQQPNLSGVLVNYTDSSVELTGSVPTGKDKHQARMMAQNYANGRKVVDHINVTGRGH
jgi:type IV secretory pathway VirB10-like protein